jgi:6-phosphogluconolactonase (cycloisomerase 2 family)
MDIKKKEIITIQTVKTNTFGDLEFTNAEGKLYKIGKARVNNFAAIQEGAEVELIWVANPHKPNTDYIYSATQTGKHVAPSTLVEAAKKLGAVPVDEIRTDGFKPQPIQDTPKSKSTPLISQSSTKDRAVAISYSKDLVIASKIELKNMVTYADKFLEYILRED